MLTPLQEQAVTAFVDTLNEFNPPKTAFAETQLEAAFNAKFHHIVFAHSNIMWNKLILVDNHGRISSVPFSPAFTAPNSLQMSNLTQIVFNSAESLTAALNRIDGVFAVITDEGSHIYLNELHLSPSFRGQGVGSSFLQTIIRFAAQQGKTLDLNILADGDGYYLPEDPEFPAHAEAHQKKLHKFYLKNGFTVNPDWTPEGPNMLGEYVLHPAKAS